MIRLFATLAMTLTAVPAAGDTDFTALTPEERAVFHAEIRAVLLQNPELASARPPAVQDIYAGEIASDLALITENAAQLFDPTAADRWIGSGVAFNIFAVFVTGDCPDCDRALRDLETLSETHNLRVHVLEREDHAALADRLGVDTLPFYVFPKMMLRGHMPAAVIAGYLERGTGQ